MAQKIGQLVSAVLSALKRLGGSARPTEVYAEVIKDLGIEGDPILNETLKSGGSRFTNRVQFARLYLVQAGYIDRSQKGVWTLTDKGRKKTSLTDAEVHKLLLDIQRKNKKPSKCSSAVPNPKPPPVLEDAAYAGRLLAIVRKLPPSGFERLCQRLLRESGFQQVTVTGRSGDGGIDGIGVLRINSFVTFKVLFQCKRYTGTVGASAVRDFRGAMQGRADKGIILTTAGFSVDASKEATRDGVPPIELVDGEQLVSLFADLQLGLRACPISLVSVAEACGP